MFKKRKNVGGQDKKHKSLLVVKGYSEVEGVNLSELFFLVSKLTSIRVLLNLATKFDLEIEKMDSKTIFLHGDLEEDIYIKKLEGFIVKGDKELVFKRKDRKPMKVPIPMGVQLYIE